MVKKEVICGIYKIISPSGRIYIGQSKNIKARWKSYHGRNSGQPVLENSFKKYGIKSHIFEVIEECKEEDLDCRERYWQDFYDVLNGGLNCKLTSCGDERIILSEETKRIISRKRIESGIAKGGSNGNAKKVINYKTKEVLNCAKDLANKLGIKYQTMMAMLNGYNYNSTDWCFLDDYISEGYKKNLKPDIINNGKMIICTKTLKVWRNITHCALDINIKPVQLMRYLNKNNDRKNPTTFELLSTYIENNPDFMYEELSDDDVIEEIKKLNSDAFKKDYMYAGRFKIGHKQLCNVCL
jgi:group I intron endonuclease